MAAAPGTASSNEALLALRAKELKEATLALVHPKKELAYTAMADIREHILLRPDTYIGSVAMERTCEWVYRKGKIQYEIIEYVPGFIRLFIEILSNAIDNKWRSDENGIKCTKIAFKIDPKSGKTQIWNDGMTIPLKYSNQKGCENLLIPTMVFGRFWTSSNYNDTEERKTSGRNGYGAKLSNVFSTFFQIRTYDKTTRKRFSQIWRNNMTIVEPPVIEENVNDTPFTEITWIPDRERLLSNYTDGVVALIYRFMYDAAMITGLPVYINNRLLEVKSITDYARCFLDEADRKTSEIMTFRTPDSEVVLMTNRRNPFILSFANGILTKKGGIHVRTWFKALYEPLAAALSPKEKDIVLTADDVSKYFTMIISCSIDKPKFDSQAKDELVFPAPTTKVTPAELKKILKWEVIKDILEVIEAKRMAKLKKLSAKKRGKPVDKLDDANLAGPGTGIKCVLVLCEGESAQAAALTGIQVGYDGKRGKDYFGILPLGGKILNVTNADIEKIGENEHIQDLIQALGLQVLTDYTVEANYRKLNYGSVLIFCDGDADGLHIEGLVLNFFQRLFPSILKRKEPYVVSMRTPIVRAVMKDGTSMNFYRSTTFENYIKTPANAAKIVRHKYFKGLGTYTDSSIADVFGKRRIFYHHSELCDTALKTAFSEKFADKRKEWILKYRNSKFVDLSDGTVDKTEIIDMSFADFVNYDLIVHSDENCSRMLPSVMDGYKESTRKIVYALLSEGEKYKKKELKVSQLAGLVSQKTEYHHGEQCLVSTIIGLAQSFVGTNNISVLQDEGQFGCRMGTTTAAAGRYLFTKLDDIVDTLFPSADFKLIRHRYDDKTEIEPYWYAPILPLLLINGEAAGIGTGFSSSVPAYHPLEVAWLVKEWISRKGDILEDRQITVTKRGQVGLKKNSAVKGDSVSPSNGVDPPLQQPAESKAVEVKETITVKVPKIRQIKPWYNGFSGAIEKDEQKSTRYITYGKMDENYRITELPIGTWTMPYLEMLKKMKTEGKIKSFRHYCTKATVDITIVPKEKLSYSDLKLTSYLHTSNIVCLDENERIRKYSCIEEVADNFCTVRLKLYERRKALELEELRLKALYQENAIRFLREVIADDLKLYEFEKPTGPGREAISENPGGPASGATLIPGGARQVPLHGGRRKGRKRAEVEKELTERKYDLKDGTYNYLLSIQISSLTDDKLNAHQKTLEKARADYERLLQLPPEAIWLSEIAKFETAYARWFHKWQLNTQKMAKLSAA